MNFKEDKDLNKEMIKQLEKSIDKNLKVGE